MQSTQLIEIETVGIVRSSSSCLSQKSNFHLPCSFCRNFLETNQPLFGMGHTFFIEKSSSHKLNRSTYGGQKKRDYVKFMLIVLPASYVIDILDPFQGIMNDENITAEIIDTNDSIATWLDD